MSEKRVGRPPAGENKLQPIMVRLPHDVRKWYEDRARSDNQSLSEYVREILVGRVEDDKLGCFFGPNARGELTDALNAYWDRKGCERREVDDEFAAKILNRCIGQDGQIRYTTILDMIEQEDDETDDEEEQPDDNDLPEVLKQIRDRPVEPVAQEPVSARQAKRRRGF